MTVRVGYDVVPAQLSASGVGRYSSELHDALKGSSEVDLVPLGERYAARPTGTFSRLRRGLLREGVYYPRGLEREARRRGADVVHCPGGFLGVVRDRALV